MANLVQNECKVFVLVHGMTSTVSSNAGHLSFSSHVAKQASLTCV